MIFCGKFRKMPKNQGLEQDYLDIRRILCKNIKYGVVLTRTLVCEKKL